MKSTLFTILSLLLLVSTVYLPLSNAQDATTFGLPDGAKARLGKGRFWDFAYSPDGNAIAVASSIGVWLYDAQTYQELFLLQGHTEGVRIVAFSPDGQTLASGSNDGNAIKLWDVRTGEIKHTLDGYHNYGYKNLAFSPDGNTLASGNSNAIKLWDVRTGEIKREITGHTDWRLVDSLAFSPDGQTLASGSRAGPVGLWDVATGERKHELIGPEFIRHTSAVDSLAFSPDGQTLASGSKNVFYLWDVATGERKQGRYGYYLVFSPDGQTFASSGGRSYIDLRDVATGELKHKIRVFAGGVAFSSDGQTLASYAGGGINFWDVATGEEKHTHKAKHERKHTADGHTERVVSFAFSPEAFSPDGQTLVSVSEDGTIVFSDGATGERKHILDGHTERVVLRVAISPNGNTLATLSASFGSDDYTTYLSDVATGEIKHILGTAFVAFSPDGNTFASRPFQSRYSERFYLRDVATGKIKRALYEDTKGYGFYGFAFSPDGNTFAGTILGGDIGLWDMATGEIKHTLIEDTTGWSGNNFAFSPDGNTLAMGGSRGTLSLWDVATGEQKHELIGHAERVRSVAFSPDGNTLASSSGAIGLWDVATGEIKHTLEGHTGGVESFAFSPDGNTLASHSADGTTYLWDVADVAKHKHTLIGTGFYAFSPDGRTLASANGDGTLSLWDVATGEQKHTLDEYQSFAFSPDGNTLAMGGSDGTTYLWDVAAGELKRELRGHTGWVESVAFSPDGRTLASGSWDSTVLLWEITPAPIAPIAEMPQRTADVNNDGTVNTQSQSLNLAAYYPFDGNAEDASGNGNHGQGSGTIDYVSGKFGKAIELNNGEYIEMEASESLHGDFFKTDPFTLAVWIYPKTQTRYGHVWRSLPLAAGHNTLFIIEGQGIISWRGHIDGTWSWDDLCETDPGVFKADTWIHVAVTNDGDKLRIYVDGEKAAETDFQETDGGNTIYRIGSSRVSGETFAGLIDDYAVFSSTLSEDEINLIIQDGVESLLTRTRVVDDGMDIRGDVNGDGTINIQDLISVAGKFSAVAAPDDPADVNKDGTIDDQDLIAVDTAFGEAAGAPTIDGHANGLTRETVQRWLTEAQALAFTDPISLRGIAVLQQLLAALTPKETALLPNYPNPFNPETWIPYQLAVPAAVTVRIYAVDGSLVRALDLGHQRPGMYQSRARAAHWDGRNAVGEPVASGVYFYTFKAGDFSATRKMLIRK